VYYFDSITTADSAGAFLFSIKVSNDDYGSFKVSIYEAQGYSIDKAIVVYFSELDTYGYYFS
jgi:hypothetical protein